MANRIARLELRLQRALWRIAADLTTIWHNWLGWLVVLLLAIAALVVGWMAWRWGL